MPRTMADSAGSSSRPPRRVRADRTRAPARSRLSTTGLRPPSGSPPRGPGRAETRLRRQHPPGQGGLPAAGAGHVVGGGEGGLAGRGRRGRPPRRPPGAAPAPPPTAVCAGPSRGRHVPGAHAGQSASQLPWKPNGTRAGRCHQPAGAAGLFVGGGEGGPSPVTGQVLGWAVMAVCSRPPKSPGGRPRRVSRGPFRPRSTSVRRRRRPGWGRCARAGRSAGAGGGGGHRAACPALAWTWAT